MIGRLKMQNSMKNRTSLVPEPPVSHKMEGFSME